jgi:hypothetical protein
MQLITTDKLYDPITAAKNIRIELKHKFPGIKFSVRKQPDGSIYISYKDDVSREAIRDICDRYQYGHFNGMIDCYESKNNFDHKYGCTMYVLAQRDSFVV